MVYFFPTESCLCPAFCLIEPTLPSLAAALPRARALSPHRTLPGSASSTAPAFHLVPLLLQLSSQLPLLQGHAFCGSLSVRGDLLRHSAFVGSLIAQSIIKH